MDGKAVLVAGRVQAATLVLFGLILCCSAFADGGSLTGLYALVVGLCIGFALLFISMLMERWLTFGVVSALALTAAVVWLVGWLWPWSWGLTFWVPFGLFGAIAGPIFGVAAIVVGFRRDQLASLRLGLLSAGSLLSSAIAFSNVTFTPPFVFVPLAIAAIVAGVFGSPWHANNPRARRPETVPPAHMS
ncbi:hypothetical protein [Microbacterium proteolyticum]|uniref:hypothetical protein n=1 Tax=Microbacterium proteolyticum TaxID=1572644 RepID=UPI001FACC37F|nr:hypothetical protein [Microbacterium proteolyticum]MCI9859637.1 hypothetical protein [Microbacterium proteolyticum]